MVPLDPLGAPLGVTLLGLDQGRVHVEGVRLHAIPPEEAGREGVPHPAEPRQPCLARLRIAHPAEPAPIVSGFGSASWPPLCAPARSRTLFPPFAPTEFMVFYRWRRHRQASERDPRSFGFRLSQGHRPCQIHSPTG